MNRTGLGLVILLSAALVAPIAAWSAGGQAGPQSRTIYVSISEKDSGKPIPGLTAADFKVRDGKDREITAVAVPTTRAKVTVLVEEALWPDGGTRQGILAIAQRLLKVGDISLVVAGNRNTVAVEHTSEMPKIFAVLNAGAPTVQIRAGNHMSDGVFELAKAFQQAKTERPIILAVALELDGQRGEHPDSVLNQLRLSRAMLETVAVEFSTSGAGDRSGASADAIMEATKVTTEGPKQSGGRRFGLTNSRGIPRALEQAAADIEAQYAITYVIPAGEKPQDRISVSTSRKNVTLLAPTRVNQN